MTRVRAATWDGSVATMPFGESVYADTGCPEWGILSCLGCPLSACRYDLPPGRAEAELKAIKLRQLLAGGLPMGEAATQLGVSRRTVYRLHRNHLQNGAVAGPLPDSTSAQQPRGETAMVNTMKKPKVRCKLCYRVSDALPCKYCIQEDKAAESEAANREEPDTTELPAAPVEVTASEPAPEPVALPDGYAWLIGQRWDHAVDISTIADGAIVPPELAALCGYMPAGFGRHWMRRYAGKGEQCEDCLRALRQPKQESAPEPEAAANTASLVLEADTTTEPDSAVDGIARFRDGVLAAVSTALAEAQPDGAWVVTAEQLDPDPAELDSSGPQLEAALVDPVVAGDAAATAQMVQAIADTIQAADPEATVTASEALTVEAQDGGDVNVVAGPPVMGPVTFGDPPRFGAPPVDVVSPLAVRVDTSPYSRASIIPTGEREWHEIAREKLARLVGEVERLTAELAPLRVEAERTHAALVAYGEAMPALTW